MTGTLPIEELFDGLCLVIAGALLLTPGFVTDTIGFSLLIPPIRRFLQPYAMKYGKFTVASHSSSHGRPYSSGQGDIIEGEYEEVAKNKEKLDNQDKSL